MGLVKRPGAIYGVVLQKVQGTNISDVSWRYKFRCRYNYDLLLHVISDDAENTGFVNTLCALPPRQWKPRECTVQIRYARTHCRTNLRRLYKLATLCTLLKHNMFRILFIYNGICLVETDTYIHQYEGFAYMIIIRHRC